MSSPVCVDCIQSVEGRKSLAGTWQSVAGEVRRVRRLPMNPRQRGNVPKKVANCLDISDIRTVRSHVAYTLRARFIKNSIEIIIIRCPTFFVRAVVASGPVKTASTSLLQPTS